MDEGAGRPRQGDRTTVPVGGDRRPGTVQAVTYTPKKGHLVASVRLDEPAPDGRETVAAAVEDLEPIGE